MASGQKKRKYMYFIKENIIIQFKDENIVAKGEITHYCPMFSKVSTADASSCLQVGKGKSVLYILIENILKHYFNPFPEIDGICRRDKKGRNSTIRHTILPYFTMFSILVNHF